MLFLALLSLMACEAECPDDTRLNGDYAAWSYATAPTADITGEGVADYPWPDAFVQGWSEWDLTYVSARDEVNLVIDGQPFIADFARQPEDCRNFKMSFVGTYLSAVGSTHAFSWRGWLSYQGPHRGGSWEYEDTWSWPEEGTSGSIQIPEGQISLNAGGRTDDTGAP